MSNIITMLKNSDVVESIDHCIEGLKNQYDTGYSESIGKNATKLTIESMLLIAFQSSDPYDMMRYAIEKCSGEVPSTRNDIVDMVNTDYPQYVQLV